MLIGCGGQRALGPGVAAAAKLAARWSRSRSHPRRDRGRLHSRLSRSRASLPPTSPPAESLPHPPLPGLPPGLSSGPPPPSVLALAELPPLPALPLRPELLAPWGPGVHLALPELPPEVCAPAPPPAALALQDLPRLPAPAPPPAHLPLPPLPEAAVAAIPGPVAWVRVTKWMADLFGTQEWYQEASLDLGGPLRAQVPSARSIFFIRFL